MSKTPRQCYYIQPDQDPKKFGGYVPSLLVENENGHSPLVGKGMHAVPWIWGKTLEEAEQTCLRANAIRGFSKEEVFDILVSTMNLAEDET